MYIVEGAAVRLIDNRMDGDGDDRWGTFTRSYNVRERVREGRQMIREMSGERESYPNSGWM